MNRREGEVNRRFAAFTLIIQVLGHSSNMALEHDNKLVWFSIHMIAGIGSIAVLYYSKESR